jgi:hypothetical protein
MDGELRFELPKRCQRIRCAGREHHVTKKAYMQKNVTHTKTGVPVTDDRHQQ